MKKFITGFLFSFSVIMIIPAQDLHSAAEIFKIMEESEITYEFTNLHGEIEIPDRSENLNYHNAYRVIDENGIHTYEYSLEGEAAEHFKKAEEYFNTKKLPEARDEYLKVLEIDSTFFKAMTYIGQTYEIENNLEKASEWYQKTIQANYIDYMAHWFLADAYKNTGEKDKALLEITIAHILNRNNPRIIESMNEIFKMNKLNRHDWAFNPQMRLEKYDKDKVRIVSDPTWLGYAMTKSVWQYEPGYRESMGVKEDEFSFLEEKECFISLLGGLDKKVLKKTPEFKALNLAVQNDLIDEYIVYEILLPEYPFVAYQFPEEFIENISRYLIDICGKKV